MTHTKTALMAFLEWLDDPIESDKLQTKAEKALIDSQDEIIKALTANTWRDIKDAPRDGSTIIGWSPCMLEPCTLRWDGHKDWEAVWERGSVIDHMSDFCTQYKCCEIPTHWKPLDEPPKPEQPPC